MRSSLALLFGLTCLGLGSVAGSMLSAVDAAPAKAKLTITRTNDYRSSLMSARIEVNGRHATDLDIDKTYGAFVAPGEVTLSASHWATPGRYTLKFKAEAGKTYRFTVSIRDEQQIAGMLGGLTGMLIESAVNENGGMFKVTPAR